MDSILRSLVIYGFLLLLFRATGKRALAQMTAFDLILLLLIGEAASHALIGDDYSLVNAMLIVATLALLELGLSHLKHRSPGAGRWLDDVPLILIKDGKPLQQRMDQERVDLDDILEAARLTHGLESLRQIKYAVLERDGELSIIPRLHADRASR